MTDKPLEAEMQGCTTGFSVGGSRRKRSAVARNCHSVFKVGKLLPQIDDGLGNLVSRFNGFGIGLVISLGNNQINQLSRQVHIGVFQ